MYVKKVKKDQERIVMPFKYVSARESAISFREKVFELCSQTRSRPLIRALNARAVTWVSSQESVFGRDIGTDQMRYIGLWSCLTVKTKSSQTHWQRTIDGIREFAPSFVFTFRSTPAILPLVHCKFTPRILIPGCQYDN